MLKERHISINSLSRTTDIPYSTLNDLFNRKTSIYKVQYGYIKKIAEHLQISINDLEQLLISSEDINFGKIIVKNKKYYLYDNKFDDQLHYLCKVNALNTEYIKTLAQWKHDELVSEKEEKEWENTILTI